MERDARAAFALGAPRPEDTLIVIDGRGSGCNAIELGQEDAARWFTIETVADDVLAVVRARGLTDYVLYGASFGTTTALVAASRSQSSGLPPPRLVVLEGVVGRAFNGFESYFSEFEREWRRVKPTLPAAWRLEFEREPWSTTLFYSREQWGAFISLQLILGESPRDGHLLNHWLDGLSRRDPVAQQYVGSFMASVNVASAPSPLFTSIACNELWGSWRSGRVVMNGELRASGEDVCGPGVRAATWDSTRFRTDVPIVVFHGPFDPTTTTAQARFFVDGHTPKPRLVTVPRASHAPLTLGLAGRRCASGVWTALLGGREPLEAALTSCNQGGAEPVLVE